MVYYVECCHSPSPPHPPQEMKFKIMIKNKKVGPLEDTLRRKGKVARGDVMETEDTSESDEDDDDDEATPLIKTRSRVQKPQVKKEVKVSRDLAHQALVVPYAPFPSQDEFYKRL